MREVKFRAWQKAHKKMLSWEDFFLFSTIDDAFNNPQYEIMQFTGLLDKNNKEIYEGDILRFDADNDLLSYVVFSVDEEPRAVVGFKLNNGKYAIDWYGTEIRREVIGNIYQNKELLND